MAVPVPDSFTIPDGLTPDETREYINKILREGVAEGDSTTMDLLKDYIFEEELKKDKNRGKPKSTLDLKHDPCYEDEDTRKAIDIFGREAWERGERPTILQSAGCHSDGNSKLEEMMKKRNRTITTKLLLKLGLAKEVNNES